MTEEHLKRIEDAKLPHAQSLIDEVHRLRALVVDACCAKPWMHIDSNGTCPWCNGDQTLLPTHTKDCPAFTPDGDLR